MPAAGGKTSPVSQEALAKVHALFEREVPTALAELLALPISPCVGGRSCEVLFNADGALEILAQFPEWPAAGIFPVGGDGCGNYFVLQQRTGQPCPVLFIEPMSGTLDVQYAAASDFEHFLVAVLENVDWFKEHLAERLDPQLRHVTPHPLPWEA